MSKNQKLISNKTELFFIVIACYSVLIQAFLLNNLIYSALKSILIFQILSIVIVVLLLKKIKINNFTINYVGIILFFTICLGLLYSIIFDQLILNNPLIIPYILMIIGYNLEIKNKFILLVLYSLCTSIVGWYVVFKYGNGLLLSEQYFFAQKNQLGAILGVSVASMLYLLFSKIDNKKLDKKYYSLIILLFLGNLVPLFLLRNRATMLAIIICIIAVSIKTLLDATASKTKKMLLFSVFIFILFIGNFIFEFIYDAFFLNFDVTDMNSISADRVSVYFDSLNFIKDNVMFGEFIKLYNISDPHNFILFNLQKKGLLLSFGFLIIYFYFLFRTVYCWINTSVSNLSIANYLLLISLIGSFFEYLQPFGPGTTQLLTWYFVGNDLRRRRNYGKND